VLLKLAYLSASSVFAMLRLLPMSDRDKDVEILAYAIRSPCWNGN
jgi:putative transposase